MSAPAHSVKHPRGNYTVIDAKDHVLGRLGSVVAKQLLMGNHIVIVRCEDAVLSGHFFRNKLKWQRYLNLRTRSNPKHGPFHFRAPGRMVHKVIRGMIPHKTARGAAAMSRLKVFEGIPPPYDKVKRVVVPAALKVLRVQAGRPTTRIGDIGAEFGWPHQELIKSLEAKRKARSAVFYKKKRELAALRSKTLAAKAKEMADVNKTLAAAGH